MWPVTFVLPTSSKVRPVPGEFTGNKWTTRGPSCAHISVNTITRRCPSTSPTFQGCRLGPKCDVQLFGSVELFCGSCLKHRTRQPALPLLAPLETWSSLRSRSLFDILLTCAFAKWGIVLLLISQDLVSEEERVPARLSVTSVLRKGAFASPSLIDSLGSALRAAAQPDSLRRASSSPRTQRAPGNNPVSLPFPCKQRLFTHSQGGNEGSSDRQTILWCTLHVSTGFFFLFLSSSPPPPQNVSVSCQSFFFPSHGPCWHRNPSLLTRGRVGHVGGHYYSWGSVIHSVTRCQREVSVCTAAPLTLFISQGWLMRSTRLIPPLEQQWLLNLLIHLDTANWNPCKLHSGHHPFSCKPPLQTCMWSDLILGSGARINSPSTGAGYFFLFSAQPFAHDNH